MNTLIHFQQDKEYSLALILTMVYPKSKIDLSMNHYILNR